MLTEAQLQCIDRAEKVLTRLEEKFGNKPVYIRVGSDLSSILDSLFIQAEKNIEESCRKRFGFKKGTRLPDEWELPVEWLQYALDEGFTKQEAIDIAIDFKDYWTAETGKDAMKANWKGTWQRRVRDVKKYNRPDLEKKAPELPEAIDALGKDICKEFPSIGENYWKSYMADAEIKETDVVTITFKQKFIRERVEREIGAKLEKFFNKRVVFSVKGS